MPNHGERPAVLIMEHNIMIMDQSVRIVRFNRVNLYSSMNSLDAFIAPEQLAFCLQKKPGILHLSAMLLEALDCRFAPNSIPCHSL